MYKSLAFAGLSLYFAAATNANQGQTILATNTPYYKKPSPYGNRHAKPYFNANWAASYDTGLFSPIEDFSVLSEQGFTTLEHPAFPSHSVRIKKIPGGFCDDTVRCTASGLRSTCFVLTFTLARILGTST